MRLYESYINAVHRTWRRHTGGDAPCLFLWGQRGKKFLYETSNL